MVAEPDGSSAQTVDETIEPSAARKLSQYEQLKRDLAGDARLQKDVTLGKRVGFYRIRGELGSGNFSQVKLATHALTKEKVAIKILDKTKLDQKTQRLLFREIGNMEKLHHPNIIRLYEVVETLSRLHIIMEYAGGGELFTKITTEGKLSESEARPLFSQVVSAVNHMHSKTIIHRDIKAENVFFATPVMVKVGDFGFSTLSGKDELLTTFCGSPPYAAPELFQDDSYKGVYVDAWALGILLYFMVTGIMPFRADTVSKLKARIVDGHFTIPPYVSESCQTIVRGVLKLAPTERFSVEQLRKSKWLEGLDFPDELPPYPLNPSLSDSNLNEEELEARRRLAEFGISRDHFFECHGRESRSAVTGTYRIVLHRIQKQRRNMDDAFVNEDDMHLSTVSRSTRPGERPRHSPAPSRRHHAEASISNSKTSRTCHIL